MVVTPPAAAAWAADFSVSLGSKPGSPVFTRMSTRPGINSAPPASMTSTSLDRAPRPLPFATSAMTPSVTMTPPGPS